MNIKKDNTSKNGEQETQKKKMTNTVVTIAVVAVLVAIVVFLTQSGYIKFTAGSGAGSTTDKGYDFELIELDLSLTYYADIVIEGYGTITVKLDRNAAPKTVQNFVSHAMCGFYDGRTFHRIIEGFMMQGGDDNGDGIGGSGHTVVGEFKANGYDNDLSHTRGAISMARTSAYNSASSQFFIMHEDRTTLDGAYAAFGYVTEGIEIVDRVCADATPTDNNGYIAKSEQPVIKTITIRTVAETE